MATSSSAKTGPWNPPAGETGGLPPPFDLNPKAKNRPARRLFLLAALAAIPAALCAVEEKREPPAVEPSAGYNAGATVARGGSCEIQLRAIPFGGAPVEFKVPRGPGRGSLSGPVRISPGTVAYTYTHDGSAAPAADSFQFRFKAGPGKSWATRTATIEIVEPPPVLEATPGRLDFGTVFIGSSANLPLRIRNSGGGELAASLQASPPWSIPGGMSTIALAPGESVDIPVGFTPTAADTQKGSLSFKMREGMERVPLGGAGRLRFSVQEKVSFDPVPGAPPVEIPVRNLTPSPLALELRAEKPLSCAPSLEIAPDSEAMVRLAVENRHYTAESAKLAVADGASTVEVRAVLPPPPARLEWASPNATLDIGAIPLRHTARPEAELRNTGATHAKVALRTEGTGFSLDHGQPALIEIPPGQSEKIRTSWHLPPLPGRATALLVAFHGGIEHPLELSARVSPPHAAPEKKAPDAAPAPAPPNTPKAAALPKAEQEEVARRMPKKVEYRVIHAGRKARAEISWEYSGPEPVEFWLEEKSRQRRTASGLAETFKNRFEVPDQPPQTENPAGWTRITGGEAEPRRLEGGKWVATISLPKPGYHAIRIAAQSPPGAPRTDGPAFAVRVDPPPPNPLWKWIAAAIGISCLAYLLRKKIPFRPGPKR